MFESILVTPGISSSYAALEGYTTQSSAYSSHARLAIGAASVVLRHLGQAESIYGTTSASVSRLIELIEELHVDDEQKPVTAAAFENATRLLRALPRDLPPPSLSIDPDGEISLDWQIARRRMLSVSIGENDRLAVAWLDGGERGHAVLTLPSLGIGEKLLQLLRWIVTNGVTSVRAF